MPYKSKAQARAMHAKAARGEIPKSVVEEYDRETDFRRLPERVRKSGREHPVHAKMRKHSGVVR